jgi:hypothetical protein
MSELADIIHSEVDAARIDLDNQSSNIRDRMMELRERMEKLERKQTPQKDGLAFESAMAITASSDVDIRGALQWHLAEVSRHNFKSDKSDSNDILTRRDLEQQVTDGLAQIKISERRLEELQSTTAAERDVLMNDISDLITTVKESPLIATAEKGTGLYIPLTDLKSVAGLRPKSREHIDNYRQKLGQLHQLFLTKTATMVSENISLSKENEALRREVNALRESASKQIPPLSPQQQLPFDAQQYASFHNTPVSTTNIIKEENPLLTFAMDNIMRVMILSRIPPTAANEIYEKLLDFSNNWTEKEFLESCKSAENFAKAIKELGIYTPTEGVKTSLSRDTFFSDFQKQSGTNVSTNLQVEISSYSKEEEKTEKVNGTLASATEKTETGTETASKSNAQEAHEAIRPTHIEKPIVDGTPEEKKATTTTKSSKNTPETTPPPPPAVPPTTNEIENKNKIASLTNEGIKKSGQQNKKEEKPESDLVAVKTASTLSEVEIGCRVYVKMSNWKQAHGAIVTNIREDGLLDVKLSNGRIAEAVASTYLVWGV